MIRKKSTEAAHGEAKESLQPEILPGKLQKLLLFLETKYDVSNAGEKFSFLLDNISTEEVEAKLKELGIGHRELLILGSNLTKIYQSQRDSLTESEKKQEKRENAARQYRKAMRKIMDRLDIRLEEIGNREHYMSYVLNDHFFPKGYTEPTLEVCNDLLDRFFNLESGDEKYYKKFKVIQKIEKIFTERKEKTFPKSKRAERTKYAVRDLEFVDIMDTWKEVIIPRLIKYLQDSQDVSVNNLKTIFKNQIAKQIDPMFLDENVINWNDYWDELNKNWPSDNQKDKKIECIKKVFGFYDFTIGNPGPYGKEPPKAMIDAYKDAVAMERKQGYGHSMGELPLRQELVKFYTRRIGFEEGVLDTSKIIVGSGSSEIIELAYKSLNEEAEVVGFVPIYPLYVALAGEYGTTNKNISYEIGEDGKYHVDIDELANAVTPESTFLLVNSPNNPTGAIFTEEEIRKIVDFAKEFNLILISDEVYVDDVLNPEVKRQIEQGKQISFAKIAYEKGVACLATGSISKGAGEASGWRVGWGFLVDKENKAQELWEAIKKFAAKRLCANVPAQYAAIAALQDKPDVRAHLERIQKEIGEQKDAAVAALMEIDDALCPEPEGGYYAFFRLPGLDDFDEERGFAKYLLMKRRVGIIPGKGFDYDKPGYYRLVYLADVYILKDGIQIIKEELENWKKLPPPWKKQFVAKKVVRRDAPSQTQLKKAA